MEDMDVPTEHLHEQIEEKAREGNKWALTVALSTALMAVLAAITSLLAGHHANEAVIEQIRASDQWAYYQAKGIKAEIAEMHISQMQALGKAPDSSTYHKLQQYKLDQSAISKIATEKEQSADHHLQIHLVISKAVTLFQIAIAISAISILVRRKSLWLVSLVLAFGGIFFMVLGLVAT